MYFKESEILFIRMSWVKNFHGKVRFYQIFRLRSKGRERGVCCVELTVNEGPHVAIKHRNCEEWNQVYEPAGMMRQDGTEYSTFVLLMSTSLEDDEHTFATKS